VKIMFLIRSLVWYGGAQRQLVNLAKGLKTMGHNIIVVNYYTDAPLEHELTEVGIEVWTLGKRSRWDIGRTIARLVRFVRSAKPDVLHGYLGTANLLTVIGKACCPSIKTVWGVRASDMRWNKYGWFHTFLFECECLLSKFADLIIVNSHAGRDYHVARGFPPKKMIVIHNGIDTDNFRPDKQTGERVRREWGIQEGERLVGLVGRLDPMKDHPTFLRAAASVALGRTDVRFVCVGQGPHEYRDDLYSLAHTLGLADRLIWTDCFRDMPAVYNALDVVVSSSVWGEGFPNVIGEAIACGIPCVATDVGDSALILAASGGELVPPHDPRGLAKGIEALLKPDERYKPEKLHKRIAESFGQDRMVRATELQLRHVVCR
jgi:glycosyltransferase involved in cell wall biosynthesis